MSQGQLIHFLSGRSEQQMGLDLRQRLVSRNIYHAEVKRVPLEVVSYMGGAIAWQV